MNKPLISIVTVSFNAIKTIEQTILSIINQTYSNIEYIIIDGGSTDGTLDIIKRYQDRISYWVSESDKGIYDAMNKGIEKSTGEWINFMNSGDEFYDKDVLTNIFSKNTIPNDIAVIYGNTEIIFPKSYILKKPLPLVNIEKGMPFCHQSSFIRTNLHKQFPYNTTYNICADYDFFYNLYKKGYLFDYKYYNISKFLYGGLSSSSKIDLIVEERHISGKKYNFYFLKKLFKEIFFGKIFQIYREFYK